MIQIRIFDTMTLVLIISIFIWPFPWTLVSCRLPYCFWRPTWTVVTAVKSVPAVADYPPIAGIPAVAGVWYAFEKLWCFCCLCCCRPCCLQVLFAVGFLHASSCCHWCLWRHCCCWHPCCCWRPSWLWVLHKLVAIPYCKMKTNYTIVLRNRTDNFFWYQT